jgi:hypothetical protein
MNPIQAPLPVESGLVIILPVSQEWNGYIATFSIWRGDPHDMLSVPTEVARTRIPLAAPNTLFIPSLQLVAGSYSIFVEATRGTRLLSASGTYAIGMQDKLVVIGSPYSIRHPLSVTISS